MGPLLRRDACQGRIGVGTGCRGSGHRRHVHAHLEPRRESLARVERPGRRHLFRLLPARLVAAARQSATVGSRPLAGVMRPDRAPVPPPCGRCHGRVRRRAAAAARRQVRFHCPPAARARARPARRRSPAAGGGDSRRRPAGRRRRACRGHARPGLRPPAGLRPGPAGRARRTYGLGCLDCCRRRRVAGAGPSRRQVPVSRSRSAGPAPRCPAGRRGTSGWPGRCWRARRRSRSRSTGRGS